MYVSGDIFSSRPFRCVVASCDGYHHRQKAVVNNVLMLAYGRKFREFGADNRFEQQHQ